jgi:hypothetical protein
LGDQSPTWADHDAFRVVFPANLTGLAWMDNLIGFTNEGVYVVSGDGPDDSGNGTFSTPVRMPYNMGCIEPRSVFTIEDGTFFQSARGLYLLPRGFGSPIPAGDSVMDTLATFPIITGTSFVNKPGEQVIRWTCVDALDATTGATLVYDVAHKCWSVDSLSNGGTAALAQITSGQWLDGAFIAAGPDVNADPIVVSNDTFIDAGGGPISMVLRTGDVRPFGMISHGILEKCGLMAELRSEEDPKIRTSS